MVNGMARESTQELGGWKSPAFMGGVYTKARTEEVAPEMRSAVAKACAVLEVAPFVEDLDREVCAEGEEARGAATGAAAQKMFYRVCSFRESLVPVIVSPIRDIFWALMGRGVRLLNLSDSQKRTALL